MLRNHLLRMEQSVRPEVTCPGTRQGDRIQEPVTPTGDAYLRPKSQVKTEYHTETKPESGVFCRQQEQDAAGQGLSPHPEAEASWQA